MARSCRLHSERVVTHTPAGNARKAMRLRFSVRRFRQNQRQRKGKGRAPRVHLACFLIVFDKVGVDGTESSRGPRSSWRDSLAKPERLWYNGDIKKTRQRFDLECSKLISLPSSDRRLFDKRYDELNDKQGKKIAKKVKMVVTTWGPRRSSGLNLQRQEFLAILTPQKTP